MKKDKSVSVQLSIYNLIDQIANPSYLSRFTNQPQILAAHIRDIKTLINFAASNYTQKARNIINLSKQFNKSIDNSIDIVRNLDLPLISILQQSYPQLAYETFKKSTQILLEDQDNQIDWRTVLTEIQLKFLQSVDIQTLEWERCYNTSERCIEIGSTKHFLIKLGLKIEKGHIIWNIKNVLYHNHTHPQLLFYYQNELMPWIREQFDSLEDSQTHVLKYLNKSLNYVDLILLYEQLKKQVFNTDISEQDKKNGILNLYSQKYMSSHRFLQNKTVKVCFFLTTSNLKPTIILRISNQNVLKIQLTEGNTMIIKLKLSGSTQQKTSKQLVGNFKKFRFNMTNFQQMCNEIIEYLQTYQNFVKTKVTQFKINFFNSEQNNPSILVSLKAIQRILVESSIMKDLQLLNKIQTEISTSHINEGLFLSYQNTINPKRVVVVKILNNLLLKSQHTEAGYINKFFKYHPDSVFSDCMMHIDFLHQIQISQQNWLMKLVFSDIYRQNDAITYIFKQLPSIKKKNEKRQYNINLRISQNFKLASFFLVQYSTQIKKDKNGTSNTTGRIQHQIPQKYFKQSWVQYLKKRKESPIHAAEYLDVDKLIRATYYVVNHWEIQKNTKKNQNIFKNAIILMEE